MRTDDELKVFLSNKKYNKQCKTLFNKLSEEEKTYLKLKYNDSESINETIYRFLNDLNIRPTCKNCGGFIKSFRFDRGFGNFCSKSCCASYNNIKRNSIFSMQNGMYKKYNVTNPSFIKEINEKRKQTCLEKYGVEYSLQSNDIRNEIKKTCLEKYGVDCTCKLPNAIEKRYEKTLLKYGTKYPTQSKIFWDNYDFKLAKEKEYLLKKKNNSFNKSELEDESYILLKTKYPDIIRQYKSDLYPFACDFYIPSIDTYIECNYFWTHGFKQYEGTLEDNIKLNEWKEQNSDFYNNAIYTWTDLDVRKRNIAKQNNLYWIEFFTIEELKNWLNTIINK